MPPRLRAFADAVLESFWFLPLLMVSISQAVTLPAIVLGGDPASVAAWAGLPDLAERVRELADGMEPEGARALLSMIAAGMVTVVSIVFSLSFVALTLTSAQLGPRIIDYWLRSNATQWLLGLGLSAFFAALSGLLALTAEGTTGRETLMAVAIASLLGSLALIAVVLFATRMSEAIRADATVARLGQSFVAAASSGVRGEPGESEAADALLALTLAEGRPVRARIAGYMSLVNLDDIADWAERGGLRLTLAVRENDHLTPGKTIAHVVGVHGGEEADESIAAALAARMTLTERRRRSGLADFEGESLTEIALRALSPSINDPYTAIACIDRIAEGCGVLAALGSPSRLRRSEDGTVLLAAPASGAAWLAPRLLHPIIAGAEGKAIVLARLAECVAAIGRVVDAPDDREAVVQLTARIARAAGRLQDPDDRALVDEALAAGS